MSTEQMRREFEEWAGEDRYPTKTDNVGYCHPETTRAWRVWQASRAALEVELPAKLPKTNLSGFAFNEGIDVCRTALESAGITVKP